MPVRYYGTVDDHGDGTYTARYTIPTAGRYTVAVTLQTSTATTGEALTTCLTAYAPFVFSRYYNGLTPYTPPTFCTSTTYPTLLVVHSELDPSSSTYNEGSALALTYATVGISNAFTITARDQFGNVRRGDNTTHFYGYGDGVSDYFLAEFTQTQTNDYVRVSSAVDYLRAANVPDTINEPVTQVTNPV